MTLKVIAVDAAGNESGMIAIPYYFTYIDGINPSEGSSTFSGPITISGFGFTGVIPSNVEMIDANKIKRTLYFNEESITENAITFMVDPYNPVPLPLGEAAISIRNNVASTVTVSVTFQVK